jgi:hypothetical protein
LPSAFARARIEHAAPIGDRNHRQGVLASRRGQRRSVDRVDGDVAGRAAAVADVFAVVQHGGFVFFALTDHHNTVEVDGAEELAHRVDGGFVGGVFVAAADERHGTDRGGLGSSDELHCEVAVGVEIQVSVVSTCHCGHPCSRLTVVAVVEIRRSESTHNQFIQRRMILQTGRGFPSVSRARQDLGPLGMAADEIDWVEYPA